MKITRILLCLSFFIVIFSSCESYLDKKPLDGPSDDGYFSNEAELVLAINGLYSSLPIHPVDNMPVNLTLDATTEIAWDRNTSPLQAIGRGDHDSNNGYVLSIWRDSYKTIGKCNFVLSNIHKLEGKINDDNFKRYRAEARFIRSYVYQYLIDYFGDVPLMVSTSTLAEANISRTAKAKVLTFILDELEEAALDLPSTYGSVDQGRATKGAALAIRARAALNNADWTEAAKSAKDVMDLNVYELYNDYGELFSYAGQDAKEIIFSFQYLRLQNTKTHATTRAFLSRNAQGTSNKIPSQSLIDSYQCTDGLEIDKSNIYDPKKPFDNRDPRLGYTVALPGTVFFGFQFETHKDSVEVWNYGYGVSEPMRVSNQDAVNAYATFSGYCWKKYVDLQDKEYTEQSELNIIQARYAEVLLIYAEAMIENNKIDNTVYEALNLVRQRPSVNMPAISSGKSQAELREIVRKERLYELANEGFRLVDLRRWAIADEMMNSTVYGRWPYGFLSNPPKIDGAGKVDYSNVTNKEKMRVIEIRKYNKNRDNLWPIPNIEIVTNTNLEQNPGY